MQYCSSELLMLAFLEVLVQRKREIGLVLPAKYNAYAGKSQTAKILDREVRKGREMFITFELRH